MLLDPLAKFEIFRLDRRSANPGGGVCICVVKSLISSHVFIDYDIFPAIEIVSCKIRLAKQAITFTCVYIAPGISIDALMPIVNCLRDLCSRNSSNVVVGDFNLPKFDWLHCCIPTDTKSHEIFNWICDMGLQQLNVNPTRNDRILDLLFTNDPLLISALNICELFCSSDHDALNFSIILQNENRPTASLNVMANRFLWEKADWIGLAAFCRNTNWKTFFSTCSSANDCWNLFSSVLNEGLINFVPFQPIFPHRKLVNRTSKTVWRLSLKKKKIWKMAKRNPSAANKLKFKKAATSLKRALIAEVADKEKFILTSQNLGAFYKHVNSRFAHKSGIAPLLAPSGVLALTDLEKANVLNNFFASVGTVDDKTLPPLIPIEPGKQRNLSCVYFEEHTMIKLIDKLKNKTTAGPDGFPPFLFKQLKCVLVHPMCMLFNLIIQFGTIPCDWKLANVTPIFKKGSSSDPSNYRPISLTAVCCKLFESVIKNELVNFLTENELLSASQHGFLKKHSTCSNLLEAINDWSLNLDQKAGTLVAYVDFSKAFDSVSIPKLLHCLQHLGITGKLHSCIKSFLMDRKQRVKISNDYSDFQHIISGVPQGSVLGSVLFIIFINGITLSMPLSVK